MHIEAVPCIPFRNFFRIDRGRGRGRGRDQIQEKTDEYIHTYIHTSSGIGYLEAEMLKKDCTSLLDSSSSIGSEGNITSHMLVSDFISATENPCLYLRFSLTPLNNG
jgi:hypothetical protein